MEAEVRNVEYRQAGIIVDVLCDAFYGYPVMRYVLGDEGDYSLRLNTLINLFVMARVYRGETMLGVPQGEDYSAAAIVSYPGRTKAPDDFFALSDSTWAELGADAHGRYTSFGDACANFDTDVPQLHLNMIGVRIAAQGIGAGRKLMEAVHRLSEEDKLSQGVSLTTENPKNISLYEYFGYRVVGKEVVSPELTTWGFFRPNEK